MTRRLCVCGDPALDGKAHCGDFRCSSWLRVRGFGLFTNAPRGFNPKHRTPQSACKDCTLRGPMDEGNPHLWGLCRCSCHQPAGGYLAAFQRGEAPAWALPYVRRWLVAGELPAGDSAELVALRAELAAKLSGGLRRPKAKGSS